MEIVIYIHYNHKLYIFSHEYRIDSTNKKKRNNEETYVIYIHTY